MGLTIHYSLRLNNRDDREVHQTIERLRQRACELKFADVGDLVDLRGDECNFDSEDDSAETAHRWLLIQASRYLEQNGSHHTVAPTRVIAFSTFPGDGCEPANFGLCQYPDHIEIDGQPTRTELIGWSWQSSCKTQYASNPEHGGIEHFLRCHLSIVDLLDIATTLGIECDVSDEGGFYESRKLEKLVEEVGNMNTLIAGLAGRIKDRLGNNVVAEITKFPNFEHLEAEGREDEEP